MDFAEFRDFVAQMAGATHQREWRKCLEEQKQLSGQLVEHDKVLAHLYVVWCTAMEAMLDYSVSKDLMLIIEDGKLTDETVKELFARLKKGQ